MNTVTPSRTYLARQAGNLYLPGWSRIGQWMLAHLDEYGHATALPGQLKRECAFTSSKALSASIDQARDRGLIDMCSTARCLVLPGQSLAPCDATHREIP